MSFSSTCRVEFLGHIVSGDGTQTDSVKIEKAAIWSVLSTMKEAKQFLGFANYTTVNWFIQDFLPIARPLHHLNESKSVFHWTDVCHSAFTELHHQLVTAPAYPNFNRPFI